MSRGSRSSGSRGFSSGSGFGFGFRGRRARNSDTLDVEVNELEDLHRRSHEAEGNQKPLGFVKLTGAAAEAAAKEGKPLAYDDRHEIRQMFVPPNPHMCNKINNNILELVSRFGEDYEDKDYFEYLRAHYCGLNKAIDEHMQTKQQDLARNSNHDLLDMHDLMFAII